MSRNTDLQVGFLRRLLDRLLDLIVARALLEADDEINNGYVARGYTEGHAGEFAVQAGDHLADGLGRTSGRRDNVGSGATTTAPVLRGGTVDGLLGGGRGVHSRHQALDDAELVVDDLGEGREAVCGTRGVGYDVDIRCVLVLVDTQHEHGCVCGGGRDDDLLCAALEMCCGLFFGGEDTLCKGCVLVHGRGYV